MPRILLKFNAAVIKEIPLDKPQLMVGRKPDNDIVIDNPAISSHHCKIIHAGETYYVEDLDSTNGTFVNEKRIVKAGLKHNDVIGLAKHALVFIDEAAQAAAAATKAAATAPADETVQLDPAAVAEMTKAAAALPKDGKIGALRVLKGVVSQFEFELKGLSTYIGKSDRAQIPIKGAGLFGGAPDVAASIHRRPEGYVLVAVEANYPLLNGETVTAQVSLKDGDIIECGATTLQFFLK